MRSSAWDDPARRAGFDTARVILLLAILLVIVASIASPWGLVVILVACVLEVGEIAFLRRWARRLDRRTKKTTGAEAMIGAPAEVVEACRPIGTVHINGELWQARCDAGADAGQTVHVQSVDGLMLVVA
jgi:membrane protein implicated in regulation of membrane protease activity